MSTKRKITTLVAALLMTVAANAQAPQILDNNHALQRVQVQGQYLLLPVQEKEENAHIDVLVDNQMRQSFNVKLAVDKVDYYVPVNIKRFGAKSLLLDITFHGDRRSTGAVKDFLCWKEMRQSDTFDTQNQERFRPLYHHTPLYGWMNDPNGMFYKDGVYHLYFQWNPYGSQWENMNWGHSSTRDLVHWDNHGLAIEPDAIGTIFSGSCVVDKNNTSGYGAGSVIAFYTSAGHNQVQSMAYSTDNGATFKKVADNPILTSNEPDFRDPKAFWNPEIQKWNLILAVGQEMRIYSSPNLKDWTFESAFGKGFGCHEGCKQKDTRWMDYGKDHYATVTFDNAPDGRHIALAWMSNWQYANQVPTQQFRSANSIPRDLDLFEYEGEIYCGVTPSREMLTLRGKTVKKPTEACEIVVDMKSSAEITLSNTKGECVVMTYDAQKRTFAMDRTKSGDASFSDAFACVTTAPVYGDMKQLRIFIDRSSIEAIDAEGRMAMTNLVFPSEPYSLLKVKGGKAKIYNYNIAE